MLNCVSDNDDNDNDKKMIMIEIMMIISGRESVLACLVVT